MYIYIYIYVYIYIYIYVYTHIHIHIHIGDKGKILIWGVWVPLRRPSANVGRMQDTGTRRSALRE